MPQTAPDDHHRAQALLEHYQTHEATNNKILSKTKQALAQCHCQTAHQLIRPLIKDKVPGWGKKAEELMTDVETYEINMSVLENLR